MNGFSEWLFGDARRLANADISRQRAAAAEDARRALEDATRNAVMALAGVALLSLSAASVAFVLVRRA